MLLVNVGLRQLSETVKEPVLWTQDFPVFFFMLGVEQLLRVWLNYQPYRVVIQT